MKELVNNWLVSEALNKSTPQPDVSGEPDLLSELGIPGDPDEALERALSACRPEDLPEQAEFDLVPGPGEAHVRQTSPSTPELSIYQRDELPEDIDFESIPGPGEGHKTSTPRVYLVRSNTSPRIPSGIIGGINNKKEKKLVAPTRVSRSDKPELNCRTTKLDGVDIPVLTKPVPTRSRRKRHN